MLKNAINIAKGADEEKVPVSLKIPKSLKDEFEVLCKNEGVSMNSMFCALAQLAVTENKGGADKNDVLEIDRKIEQLQEEVNDYEMILSKGGKYVKDEYGNEIDLENKLDQIRIRLANLQKRMTK
ncbi:MAG: hypothetical protein QG567_718 [Campylobacterota bacterium]|nr:hypothetical protein [Campylobacterota bacterium]